jgi:hypothetical protein
MMLHNSTSLFMPNRLLFFMGETPSTSSENQENIKQNEEVSISNTDFNKALTKVQESITTEASLTKGDDIILCNKAQNHFEQLEKECLKEIMTPEYQEIDEIFETAEKRQKTLIEQVKEIFSSIEFPDLQQAYDFMSPDEKSDFWLDLSPFIGDLKGVFEAVTGESVMAGTELSVGERIINAVSAVPGAGMPFDALKAMIKLGKKAKDIEKLRENLKISDVIAMRFEVMETAKDKFGSITSKEAKNYINNKNKILNTIIKDGSNLKDLEKLEKFFYPLAKGKNITFLEQTIQTLHLPQSELFIKKFFNLGEKSNWKKEIKILKQQLHPDKFESYKNQTLIDNANRIIKILTQLEKKL